jgi:iron complex outermembrane receptor protein
MKRSMAVLFLITLCVQVVMPQTETGDTLTYQYPTEIVVTAPRISLPLKETPFSTSIVDRAFVRDVPRTIAMDEPLKLTPGVKVDNQANGSRVHLSIRGQGILTERGIRGIKILLDEIPINDPTGFAPDFFDVDLAAVDHIEVLRGPAASLYGGSAAGGIINITTKASPDRPLFAEALGTFGSNNFWKGAGQFGGNVDRVNYRVSFSRTMGDGYREHTHFWGNTLYGKATYAPTDFLTLTPIVGSTNFYHENPEGINLQQYEQDPKQANPDAVPFNEYLETNRITTGLAGSITTGKHQIQFNGHVKRTLFTEANNRTFNHRTIVTPGVSLQYGYTHGESEDFIRNTVTAGTDLQWQTIDEYRVDNLYAVEGTIRRSDEQIKQRGVGFFLIDKVNLGRSWGLMLSLRHDVIRNELNDLMKSPNDLSGNAEFSKTTGRIGATYAALPELNLYGNWGQGFLPPATEELAQNPDHFGGFNIHLVPATSSGFEVGSRGTVKENYYYDVAGFFLTTDNDFDRYRITDPLRNQETFYRNAGSSRRFGFELYTRATPVASLELQAAYTFSHFKYTNSTPIRVMMDNTTIQKYIVDGNWLPNSPAHQLCVSVQYTASPGLRFGLSTETLSKAHIDGANVESEAVAGYTLVHGRVSYACKFASMDAEFSISARNLFDRKYVAFSEPDPGGNSYQPGTGREFFGGLRIGL